LLKTNLTKTWSERSHPNFLRKLRHSILVNETHSQVQGKQDRFITEKIIQADYLRMKVQDCKFLSPETKLKRITK